MKDVRTEKTGVEKREQEDAIQQKQDMKGQALRDDESYEEDNYDEHIGEDDDSLAPEIIISVSTDFLPDQSETTKALFAFSYTIRIVNEGKVTAQLLNRHWRVFSGGRQIADVKGEGVVGEQPILQPGEAFEYESGTLIHDPIGAMDGTFTFVDEFGVFFDVNIPEFSLIHLDDLTVH